MTENISQLTRYQYQNRLDKLGVSKTQYKNFQKTYDHIKEISSNIGTQKAYLTSVLWDIRDKNLNYDQEPYVDEIKKIRLAQQKEIDKNKMSQKEEQNFITQKELDELKTKLKNQLEQVNYDDKSLYKFYVLLKLYSDTPPRRLKDYAMMKYYQKKPKTLYDDENYYIHNKKASYFLFNSYKTQKTYGTQKFIVPMKLRNELERYIEKNGIQEGSLLFSSSVSDDASNALSKFISRNMEKYHGKPSTLNTFRHSYINELQNKNPTLNKRKQISKKMSHNVMTQLEYYKK